MSTLEDKAPPFERVSKMFPRKPLPWKVDKTSRSEVCPSLPPSPIGASLSRDNLEVLGGFTLLRNVAFLK